MAQRLIVSGRAQREIGEAYEWYETRVPGLGLEFLRELDVQFDIVCESPQRYREIFPGVRRALLSHFPYGVFFASKGGVTSVLAVIPCLTKSVRWPAR